MIDLEVRTFEQRFGDRCPFCNASWGNPTTCGDQRADWTIQEALGSLFADRTNECRVCGKAIPHSYTYCFDCGQSVQRERNRRDKHIKVAFTCDRCGTIGYARRAKNQRYCSRTCSQKARWGR